jgi:DNA mismatch repair ATPase MutS
MVDRHKRERVYSSIKLFLDACELWGKTFDNNDLLDQVRDLERMVNHFDLEGCSEDTVHQIERATLTLIDNMDQVLKSFGSQGIIYRGPKH